MRRFIHWLPLLCVCACSPVEYAYVPTTNAVATIHGRVAADYPIPPAAPQGDLRIASYGLTDVSPKGAPNQIQRALHLRVVLADNGATPWTFDTREQRVELQDHELMAPAFATASPGDPPPLVTIDRNGKRVVDLFFLLPPDFQYSDAAPEFDALWRVNTSAGPIAERTPFERLRLEPDDGAYADWDYGDGYYWGGPYWINAEYPFVGVPLGWYGGGVIIHRSPHFWHGYGAYGRGFHGGDGVRGGRGGGFHGGGGGHR